MAAFSRMARPRNVALAAVLAANGVLAQNSCVTLQGITDDGTQLNYLQVSSGGTDTYTAGFVDDETQATVLGIDATTGQMLDYTDGGRIANIDAGFDFDYLFFDYQAEMDQFDQLAVQCATDADGVLTCAAADNNTVNVFNYCDGVVALSNAVQPDFGCVGLTLVATDATCPPLPSTTSSTDTATSTSTVDSGAISTTTDAGVTTTTTDAGVTTTATETTTATSSSSSSVSTGDTSILADPNSSTSSTTTTGTSSGASSVDAGVTSTVALTTSTVFGTNTVTVTEGDATSISTSTYALYTTVCPVGGAGAPAPAPTGGYAAAPGGGYAAAPGGGSYGYGAGGNNAAPGYGAGAGAAASAPVYNPAHLVALPATICASQLNAVASKYPAGAMNSYSNYGYVPVNVGANTGAANGGNGGYGANNAAPTGGNGGYGAGSGSGSGSGAGYQAGNGAGNGASNNAAGNNAAGNNAYGAGNNAAGNNAAANNAAGNAGSYAGAANNGSVAGQGAAAASGTGAYKANPTAPMQYEGSASSVKMALGGVFAAAIALVCLI